MNINLREKTPYEPVVISPQLRTYKYSTISSVRTHSESPSKLPSFLAALLFLSLLGFGCLDSLILELNPAAVVKFHEIDLLDIPVQKASYEIKPLDRTIQNAVFTEHRVVPNETLSHIAWQYGLSPATLISVNQLQRPEDLKTDTVLIVPYRDGIRHAARNGESTGDAAEHYGVESDSIQILPDGDYFVSGKSIANEIPASFASNMFRYPVTGRVITPFGEGVDELTDIPYKSDGIDLAVKSGTPVVASQNGKVVLTGHHASYGLYVIMEHKDGWKSFYGYLGRIDVAPGDLLDAGMVLGIAGKSGMARTPRLHFVLIRNGETVNPLDYLY